MLPVYTLLFSCMHEITLPMTKAIIVVLLLFSEQFSENYSINLDE